MKIKPADQLWGCLPIGPAAKALDAPPAPTLARPDCEMTKEDPETFHNVGVLVIAGFCFWSQTPPGVSVRCVPASFSEGDGLRMSNRTSHAAAADTGELERSKFDSL